MLWLLAAMSAGEAPLPSGLWLHPLCRPLEITKDGPFVNLPDGRLLTIDSEGVRISEDEGKTWSEPWPVCPGINDSEPSSYRLVRTKRGTLVLVFLDFTTYKFSWDEERGEPREDCRLELWAIRSLDGGRTWVDKQRLLGGYNANFFGFIETRKGRLVVTVEHLVSDPGRWVVCSFISDDEGRTWKRSNFIDLGGHGHHDGAMEPTVAELSDGRLLMLIRTNLGRFWEAISDDGGRYWRIIRPSPIDASTSPGQLLRLESGRLLLVWNRLNPEGRSYPKSPPGPAHEVPASWHREEISVAISEDDGRSWSKPLVIARLKGGWLCYPYLFERRPGEIWLTVGFAIDRDRRRFPLRLKLNEEELLKALRGS